MPQLVLQPGACTPGTVACVGMHAPGGKLRSGIAIHTLPHANVSLKSNSSPTKSFSNIMNKAYSQTEFCLDAWLSRAVGSHLCCERVCVSSSHWRRRLLLLPLRLFMLSCNR